MNSTGFWEGCDVILPKDPTLITLELSPAEIELAFATECGSP